MTKIREKNKYIVAFRAPKRLKLGLPGAYLETETGKIKYEDPILVGRELRKLLELYISGKLDIIDSLEQLNTKNRNLQKKIDEKLFENNILYAGARELLKLMSLSKPGTSERSKVDMSKIIKLKEVI